MDYFAFSEEPPSTPPFGIIVTAVALALLVIHLLYLRGH